MKTLSGKIWLLILLLLAGQVSAQVPVLDSVCSGAVRHYGVIGEPGSTYSWIITPPAGPSINLPSDADTVEIAWTYPAGTYQLECLQTSLNGCVADAVFGEVLIINQPDVFAGFDDIVCIDRTYKLIDATAFYYSELLWTTTGDGTWDDNTQLHPIYSPGTGDILAGTVTLTLSGSPLLGGEYGCEPDNSSLVLSIVTDIVPQFDSIGPLCQYSIPQPLPDTSLEDITGIWIPPVINTDNLGTFTYLFIPDDPTQCGVETSIFITISDSIVPLFEPIGPLCVDIPGPALPDTSLQGITGTWDPPVIATDVVGVFPYTFYPDDPSQCGVVTTMDIAVVTRIMPTFEPIGPFCQYDSPPALPSVSIENISGTWEPPVINTGLPGTFTFTFTPNVDQCGLVTTIEVIVNQQVTTEFAPIAPICQYTEAPVLPSTSLNSITGTWFPPVIITAWPGTFTYTFTPDPLTCGTVYEMQITILPELVPEFNEVGTLCQYVTPPVLPGISIDGITGTWEPPVITTDVLGTFYYYFTPDTSFQCAMPYTMVVHIVTETTPTFAPIGPLCQNVVPPALPDTSLEGIFGHWSPAVINTSDVGTFTYIFTPDFGQCAVETSIDITITDEIEPVFDPIAPICLNTPAPALPDSSLNDIGGTWVPPFISTDTPGTFTFVFTPDPGQCGTEAELEVEITDEIIPEFDQLGPYCQFTTPVILPTESENDITGTWDPPFVSTDNVGTFSFTFTPDSNQCGVEYSMDITITTRIIPDFDQIGPLCQGTEPPDLPDLSNNGVDGSWNPLNIDTSTPGTFTFTFTPDDLDEQCAVVVTMDVTILPAGIPEFEPLGPFCQHSNPVQLPQTSVDGIPGTWDPPVINTTNTGAFTYTFTPDDDQCAQEVEMEIEITAPPLVSQTIVIEETDGLHNGSIEIIATGSTPQLFYTINNGGYWQTNNGLFQGLSHGIFQCRVMDENGCDTTFIIDLDNIILTPLEAITIPGRHCLGDAALVPINVDEFHTVASFQLMLHYNVDKLYCDGFTSLNPLLDSLEGFIDQAAGIITITWKSNVEVTFATIQTALVLVFTPKEPGLGQLDWYTGATESYFQDINGDPIPATFWTDDLTIYNPPEILLAESRTVCIGDTVMIHGIATSLYPPINYQWIYPDGSIHLDDPYFMGVTQADEGDYILQATDSLGCDDTKAIRLIVSENPVADFHGSDTLVKAPGFILEAGTGQASYLWNTGATSDYIRIDTTGWYWVQLISHVGCEGMDSVYIYIDESLLMECLFIPNAFTPNSDGRNDTYKVVSSCPLNYFHMEIYNRWGELLFETDDINEGWDGKKNGNSVPGDAYVYKIAYRPGEMMVAERPIVKTGVVTVLK